MKLCYHFFALFYIAQFVNDWDICCFLTYVIIILISTFTCSAYFLFLVNHIFTQTNLFRCLNGRFCLSSIFNVKQGLYLQLMDIFLFFRSKVLMLIKSWRSRCHRHWRSNWLMIGSSLHRRTRYEDTKLLILPLIYCTPSILGYLK